eukprot:TRINITY_DN5278_c0_g1_i4.p1 TRINITY_DN5278_c0_g1~~TRINITY_DN5278_c0_g1_i4.p1  ORF type:complete len:837 (-),score=152.72 TRINITY_DN5278_c0_g1_i4:91-2601(-)
MDFTPTSLELGGISEGEGENDGETDLGLKSSEFEDDIINNNVYGGFRGFGGFGGYVNKHRHYAIHYDEGNNINLSTELPMDTILENTEEALSQNENFESEEEGEGEQEYESENEAENVNGVEFEGEASEDISSFQQPSTIDPTRQSEPSHREDLPTVTLTCENCKMDSQIECLAPGPRDDRFTFLCSDCSGSGKPFFQHLTKSWLQIVSTALYNMQILFGPRSFHIRDELCTFIEDHWNELCMSKQNTYNWNGTVSSQLFAHPDLFAQPRPKEWCLKNNDEHNEKLQGSVKREFSKITSSSNSGASSSSKQHSPSKSHKSENKSDASQSESLGSSAEHEYTSFFSKRQTRSSSRGSTSVETTSPNDSPLDNANYTHYHSNHTDHPRQTVAPKSQTRPSRAKAAKKKSKNRGGSSVRWCHQCKVLKPNTSDCCNPNIPLPLLAFVHAHQSQSSAVCEKRFCEGCLRKYGEDRKTATTTKDWMCPFCRDICSCAACRRRRESQQWKQHRKSLAATSSSSPSSNGNSPPVSQPQTPVNVTTTTATSTAPTPRAPVQVSGGFIKAPNGRLKVDAFDLERFVPSITLPESRPPKSLPIKEVFIPSFKKIRKYDFENDPRVASGELSIKGDWNEEWSNPSEGMGGVENNYNENSHFLDYDIEKSGNNHFGEKHERDVEMGFDSQNQVSEWSTEVGDGEYNLRKTSQRMRTPRRRGSRSSRSDRSQKNGTLEGYEIETGDESGNDDGEEEDTSDEAYSTRHTKMYCEDRLAIRSERLQSARNHNSNNYSHNNNNNHHDHPVNLPFLETEPLPDILAEEGNYTSDFSFYPSPIEPRTKQSKKYY